MSPRPIAATGCFRGCGVRSVGCLVLAVVLIAVALGFDVVVAPWAYSLFGRPTLTGGWVGTFTTPSGIHFALYLELDRGAGGEGSSQFQGELFSGRGYWCDNRGRHVDNGPLDGSVPIFSGYTGTIAPVAISMDNGNTAPPGLLPVAFHGEWQGDTLTVKPSLAVWTGQGMQSSSSNPDQNRPITVTMSKGDLEVYRSACAQLGSLRPPPYFQENRNIESEAASHTG